MHEPEIFMSSQILTFKTVFESQPHLVRLSFSLSFSANRQAKSVNGKGTWGVFHWCKKLNFTQIDIDLNLRA